MVGDGVLDTGIEVSDGEVEINGLELKTQRYSNMTQIDNWELKHLVQVTNEYNGNKDNYRFNYEGYLCMKVLEAITLAKEEERKRIVEEIDWDICDACKLELNKIK